MCGALVMACVVTGLVGHATAKCLVRTVAIKM